jgi:hypothetical protein
MINYLLCSLVIGAFLCFDLGRDNTEDYDPGRMGLTVLIMALFWPITLVVGAGIKLFELGKRFRR